MRLRIYNLLVNRQPGIAYRYHRFHDGRRGILRPISWLYLLWLNFAYYALFMRFLGKADNTEVYEKKRLLCGISESEAAWKEWGITPDELAEKLAKYDVISFDVFDTLILRPLSEPADVFYFVEKELGIPDFKRIRVNAERKAREKKYEKTGSGEVTLKEIWDEIAENTGIAPERGMEAEVNAERNLCYGNPFMLDVWKRLKELGNKIIIISDMYLSSEIIGELLNKNGFEGAEKLYISCEAKVGKYDGKLFEYVKKGFAKSGLKTDSMIHVGDDIISDEKMAKKAGFDAYRYLPINRKSLLYRAYDMSYMVGSAYRGIVNARLYSGLSKYSREYEYGFIYGGSFVFGYCNYIHELFRKEKADKILFLSRDGDTLKAVYDSMFPGENTEYVYWSRKAQTKIMADENRYDYFRRFIDHKVGQKKKISEILDSMELDFLKDENLLKYEEKGKDKDISEELRLEDYLTARNAETFKRIIKREWSRVKESYKPQIDAAGEYYSERLKGCYKALIVDIGWAGSGALSLKYLSKNTWNIPCEIKAVVAGTNTVHNAEPDVSEPFIQSGEIYSYLYSQRDNRDLLKKHDPAKGYNVFWEMFLSSKEPKFEGFYPDGPRFSESDTNPEAVSEVRTGIMDFVKEYRERFRDYPYMQDISGRDAYAPVLLASSYNAKYLKEIEKKFGIDINV